MTLESKTLTLESKTLSEQIYWNNYYEGNTTPNKPSSFAIFCLSRINRKKKILEFGCGNGRDSFFFASQGMEVIALDRSGTSIRKNLKKENSKVVFIEQDFTSIPDNLFQTEEIGTVYSRFTLHSVDKEGYYKVLKSAYNQLCKGGEFYIEARTINDPLFNVGTPCPDNGFINTHYRRFLLMKEVMFDLEKLGFSLIYAIEDFISSWYKDDHAVVLRIIAKKI